MKFEDLPDQEVVLKHQSGGKQWEKSSSFCGPQVAEDYIVIENMLVQWNKGTSNIRGDDEMSKSDLIFTKGPEDIQVEISMRPLGNVIINK